MTTTASQEHLNEIRELWRQAFGDSVEYINLFLEQYSELTNTLVYLQGNVVAAMMFILPCNLVFAENRYRCAYFYGIATRQDMRGKGISTQLLQYAHQLCSSRGYDVCALVPATPSLFEFYAKRGYTVQGTIKTVSVDAAELTTSCSSVDFSAISTDKIYDMREKFFGTAYLEWDRRALEYMQSENQCIGGSFYRYSLGGSCGYLCCVPRHDTLWVMEFVGSDALLPDILKGLHEIYNKQTYFIRLYSASIIGKPTPLAMTRWVARGTSEPFYLSLVLD